MTKSINEYFTILRQKDGKAKFRYSKANEANVYKYLAEQGYRTTILDAKRIYYRKTEKEVIPVTVEEIQQAFKKHLENVEFSDLPSDITLSAILEFYQSNKIVVRKRSIGDYLQYKISAEDAYKLRVKSNSTNLYRTNVKALLEKIEEKKFGKTENKINLFNKNSIIYYKLVGEKKYLLFLLNNPTDRDKSRIDCWIVNYDNENQIGIEYPTYHKCIKHSFSLKIYAKLIKEYIEF